MDAQPQRNNRRRRRRKKTNKKPAAKVEPVILAARRPDSPRLEKTTRRMKAASAKPRTQDDVGAVLPAKTPAPEAPKRRREARIIQRKEDMIDNVERERRYLLARLLASEGRAAISQAADAYLQEDHVLPKEQDCQLKLLEHSDEKLAGAALRVLAELVQDEEPAQLPIFQQRLRRLEDHAEDEAVRTLAADLRRSLPG